MCGIHGAAARTQWLEETIWLPDTLSRITYPRCLADDSTDNKIYVGGGGKCVIVIDGETDKKIARIPAGEDIQDMIWNSTDNKVYCANPGSCDVTVIDGVGNSVITTLLVGNEPCALVWNSTNNKVYSANYLSNEISIIDGVDDSIIITIHVSLYKP